MYFWVVVMNASNKNGCNYGEMSHSVLDIFVLLGFGGLWLIDGWIDGSGSRLPRIFPYTHREKESERDKLPLSWLFHSASES